MAGKTSDLGFLKRVDIEGGKSNLVDGFGKVVAVVDTATLDAQSRNLDVRRFRVTDHPSA